MVSASQTPVGVYSGASSRAVKTAVVVSDSADGKGGASVAAIRSATILARNGLDVRFFAAIGPFSSPDPVPENMTVVTMEDGMDLIRAPMLMRATRSLWNTPAAEALAHLLADLDPVETVVHIHAFQVQLTAAVIRTALDLGFKVVLTSHDYGLACPYSGFLNYNTSLPCGKRALSFGCKTTLCTAGRSVPGKAWHMAKGYLQLSRGRVPGGISHFAFVSDFSRRLLQSYLPDDARTSIIRNPLDLQKEAPRRLEPGAPFLYVGRLSSEKDPEIVARAAAKMGVPLLIAGSGPREAEVREANPAAEMLGWKTPSEIRELMLKSRALLFPSRCYEGQPLTVQEALSVGLPVVTSDVCAAVEVIDHGQNGLIFKTGDEEDLCRQMENLRSNEVATAMGVCAFDCFWADPPSAEAHWQETLAVYEEVLRSPTR